MMETNHSGVPLTVSVIIPVYNAGKFLEKAIQSTLVHDVVREVILIDDGSTDDSLVIIEEFKHKDSRVLVYHHKGRVNKGRSASRNLGVLKATSNYIAFLDADDFYLENRFEKDKLLLKDKWIDGTYNAVGFQLYRDTSPTEAHHFKIATLKEAVEPELLFQNIVSSRLGYLHLNGITIKRSVFDRIGLFNETLVVAEDSDIIFKMALISTLIGGSLDKIVARRGIHDSNVFNKDDVYKNFNPKMYESLIKWGYKNNVSSKNIDLLLDTLWIIKFRENDSLIGYILYWLTLLIKIPNFCYSVFSVKYFPLIRLRKKIFKIFYTS